MAQGLPGLAQLPMHMHGNKQVEVWLQIHPMLTLLMHTLCPTLPITPLPMAHKQVNPMEYPPRMIGVGLAPLGRSPHLTM